MANLENIKGALKFTGYVLKKHSPKIMTVVGGASVIWGTVSACKATLKVESILEKANEDMEKIESVQHNTQLAQEHNYTEEEANQDKLTVKVRTAKELIKLYGPSALGVVGGLGLMLGGFKIQTNRLDMMTRAYTTLDMAFKSYRKKVDMLDPAERELLAEGEVVYNEKKDAHDLEIKKPTDWENNTYARIFYKINQYWEPSFILNKSFLQTMQKEINMRCKRDKVLFLNDALKRFGFDPIPEGQMLGWAWDYSNDDDNQIDLGVWAVDSENNYIHEDFMKEYENSVILDFTPQGVVHTLL